MRIVLIIIVAAIAGTGFYFLAKCLKGDSSKKTGISNNSMTLEESKKNGVLQHVLTPSQAKFTLPNGKTISIKDAWIESGWSYEKKGLCKIVPAKKDYSQLVIQTDNYATNDYDSFLLGDHAQRYFARREVANKPESVLFISIDTSEHYLKYFWYRNKNQEYDTLVFKY